jgi:hypothetical protein
MKRWFLRFAVAFFVVIFLIVACFPLLAFVLAASDELLIGQIRQSHLRLFTVSSAESKGVGIEWSRRLKGHSDCYRTTVNFLLWEGDTRGQNVEYCACLDQESGSMEPLPLCKISPIQASS